MITLSYFLYGLLIHFLLIIPGLAISVRVSFAKKALEKLTLGYFFSCVIFGLLSLIWYLLVIPPFVIPTIFVLILILSTWSLRYQIIFLRPAFKPWIFFVVISLTSFFLTTLPYLHSYTFFPDPEYRIDRNYSVPSVKILNLARTPANDNYIPFRQAQFFVNRFDINTESFIREWGVNFFYRTPLMGAISGSFFLILNEQVPSDYLWATGTNINSNVYWHYQIITHVLNLLFVLPLFSLAEYFFDKKNAWIVSLTLFLSPFFLYNTIFSWPKSFVAFFVLLAWYLTIAKKNILFSSIVLAVSYYAHDLTILYVVGWFFYLGLEWFKNIGRITLERVWSQYKYFRNIVLAWFIFASFLFPWFVVGRYIYHQGSLFYFYPFALHGLPFEPHLVIKEFFQTPIIEILQIKFQSLWYLFFPLESDYLQALGTIRYFWVISMYSVYGATGILLGGMAYLGIIHFWKKMPTFLLGAVFIPIILSTIIIGWAKGLGALHFAQASVAILTILAVQELRKLRLIWLSRMVYFAQFIQYWSVLLIAYDLEPSSWFLTLSSTVIFNSIFLLTLGIAIYLPSQLQKK